MKMEYYLLKKLMFAHITSQIEICTYHGTLYNSSHQLRLLSSQTLYLQLNNDNSLMFVQIAQPLAFLLGRVFSGFYFR